MLLQMKKDNEKEKKKFLKLMGILTEINNQNEIYLKNNIEIRINNLNNIPINIECWKLASIFLNEIYKRYSKKLKEIKFKQGKEKHSIIIVIEDINNISCDTINLIIDFLKYIKVKSSSIIHINSYTR